MHCEIATRRRSFGLAELIGSFAGLVFAALAAAQTGGDAQVQILYAYQTEDLSRLGEIRSNLASALKDGAADAATDYDLAHVDYRMALLERATDRAAAERDLEQCVRRLDDLLRGAPASVEALALESICDFELGRASRLRALERTRAARSLAAARKLAPRNPRVLLIAELERRAAGDTPPPLADLEAAARAFEATSATREDAPSWGDAECYLLLGHELRLRGDVLGARNWIEKALIVAPDFKAAQRELALLTH